MGGREFCNECQNDDQKKYLNTVLHEKNFLRYDLFGLSMFNAKYPQQIKSMVVVK